MKCTIRNIYEVSNKRMEIEKLLSPIKKYFIVSAIKFFSVSIIVDGEE